MLKWTNSFRSLGRNSKWAEFLFPDNPNYTSTYKYLCLPCSIKIGKEVNPVWTQTKFHLCSCACCSPGAGLRQQQFMWTVWIVLQKYSGTPKPVHWWVNGFWKYVDLLNMPWCLFNEWKAALILPEEQRGLGQMWEWCLYQERAACVRCSEGTQPAGSVLLHLFCTALASPHLQCLFWIAKLPLRAKVKQWKHLRFTSQPINSHSQHRSTQGLKFQCCFMAWTCLFAASLVQRNCALCIIPKPVLQHWGC